MSLLQRIQQRFVSSRFDWLLFWSMIGLLTIGIFFIYSSGIDSNGNQTNQGVAPEYIRQIIWVLTGFTLFLLAALFDYNQLHLLSIWLFLGTLILLILVLLIGRYVAGARSWLGLSFLGIQPAELAKVTTIIALASFFDGQGPGSGKSFRNLIIGGFILLIPVSLIMLQPDLGSASVFLSIFFFIALFAEASGALLFFFVLLAGLLGFYILLPLWDEHIASKNFWLTNLLTDPQLSRQVLIVFGILFVVAGLGWLYYKKSFYFAVFYVSLANILAILGSMGIRSILKPYQVQRLLTFLNPAIDPLGAGWQITQSITAVGAGGLVGQGFLKGTQSHLQYLPEQSTDFIFSIILEETGFVGGMVVLLLYFIILWRILNILRTTRDHFCRYLCAGAFGMFVFHTIINVGMVLGMVPITGIPLLLVSYGGSSIWASMLMLGIVMSGTMRHY
ncbi:MAG: rod shape-determining protein RodA [Spirochaetia bacterium]